MLTTAEQPEAKSGSKKRGCIWAFFIVVVVFVVSPFLLLLLLQVTGLGLPVTYVVNRNWLECKASLGDRHAMYKVAEAYLEIKMSYEDIDRAHAWHLKAAERGHPLAIGALSWDRKWMDRGVQLKVERCLDDVSQALDFGLKGYPKDPKKAEQLRTEMMHILKLRQKLPYDTDKSSSFNGVEVENEFDLYRRSLERKFQKGHPKAGLTLFSLLRDVDDDAAISWLQKTAEVDPKSTEALWDWVCFGYEKAYTDEGDKRAVKCYTMAAQVGNRDAMMRLVNAYQYGELGLPKDKEKEDFWFLKWQDSMSKKLAADSVR